MEHMINYNYLRPKKAKHLKGWYDKPFPCRDKLNVYNLPNAAILPLKKFNGENLLFGRGGVVDENG
ncbi:hypothetical protein, partial [Klebsiella pneumoniae]|uniref:hypothetical protein n=1 Tax=Klebsiella pneumoniae TaxID=573 RepID=UPI0025A305FB